MRSLIALSFCFAVFLSALSASAADLLVDVNLEGTSDVNTQPGFTPLEVAFGGTLDPSVTVGNVKLQLDGEWGARDRENPTDFGDFTENLLLRDTAFPNTTTQNPATVTITGLTPNTSYDMSIWSYEAGPFIWDLYANGVLVVEDFAQGAFQPLTNDDYRRDFQAITTATGSIVLAYSDIDPAPAPYPEYRVNAFRIIDAISDVVGNNGDYNGNGTVDAADYTVWRDTFGQTVENGTGADGNSDGTIDDADYSHWKSRFGDVVGGSAAIAASVPEPASLMLILGAFAFWSCRFRKFAD